MLLKFVLVVDAVVSLFWSWFGASIGEQVIHRVHKIDLVLLQVIADVAILIAKRTLAREHLDCRMYGLLHATGQGYGCFADIPNTLNLRAAPRAAAFFRPLGFRVQTRMRSQRSV